MSVVRCQWSVATGQLTTDNGPIQCPVFCKYSSTDRSLFTSSGFVTFSLIIQPAWYGSRLTRPGSLPSSLLTAVIVPATPLYRSLVAFTDSISPNRPLAEILSPTFGSETYVMSV